MAFATGIAAGTTIGVARFTLNGVCELFSGFFAGPFPFPAAEIRALKFVVPFSLSGGFAFSFSSTGFRELFTELFAELSVSSDALAAASVEANPPGVRQLELPEPLPAATGSATAGLGMFSMVAITWVASTLSGGSLV